MSEIRVDRLVRSGNPLEVEMTDKPGIGNKEVLVTAVTIIGRRELLLDDVDDAMEAVGSRPGGFTTVVVMLGALT